ncbi:MAG: hypothetical protein FRX49_11861 [Trebouxia sp. A1-2]|nr:MAG: hypothetical protein FRX49_11861 [Trebouxia sp. A1-2]
MVKRWNLLVEEGIAVVLYAMSLPVNSGPDALWDLQDPLRSKLRTVSCLTSKGKHNTGESAARLSQMRSSGKHSAASLKALSKFQQYVVGKVKEGEPSVGSSKREHEKTIKTLCVKELLSHLRPHCCPPPGEAAVEVTSKGTIPEFSAA